MTEKQRSIIDSALVLFAEKGFDGISTSAIAKHASVSEGLIFKHFRDKMGLLEHILNQWSEIFIDNLSKIQAMNEYHMKIQAIMEFPFHIKREDYPYWKLVYALRWKNQNPMGEHMDMIQSMVKEALLSLRYTDIEAEAVLIMAYFDGFMTTVILQDEPQLSSSLLKALQRKYVNSTELN